MDMGRASALVVVGTSDNILDIGVDMEDNLVDFDFYLKRQMVL